MHIKKKRLRKLQAFRDTHAGRDPKFLRLTTTEEKQLLKSSADMLGGTKLKEALFLEGAQQALPKILGIPVIYRAKKFEFV